MIKCKKQSDSVALVEEGILYKAQHNKPEPRLAHAISFDFASFIGKYVSTHDD